MKKILMFKGQSKYNVVRCFVDALADGLRKNDCQVEGSHKELIDSKRIVSDSNAWLEEQFKDGEEIVYYSNDRMQAAASAIIYYLEDEEEATRITENAYRIAKEKHTWEVRAKELLDIMHSWDA